MFKLQLQRVFACTQFLAIFVAVSSSAAGDNAEPPLARTIDDSGLSWGPCPTVFPTGCEIAVLHGNPANPNADVFFRVPANYSIPHHWHTSVERMVLVSGEMHVTYDGHETTILKPGTYAYGPAEAPHRADCKDAGSCVLFIAFEGPVDVQTGDPSAQ